MGTIVYVFFTFGSERLFHSQIFFVLHVSNGHSLALQHNLLIDVSFLFKAFCEIYSVFFNSTAAT